LASHVDASEIKSSAWTVKKEERQKKQESTIKRGVE